VSARNFHVLFGVGGHAIPPVDDAILTRVNRGLEHRLRDFATKGTEKIARTASGVAVGEDSAAVLLKDPEADRFGSVENGSIRNGAANGRRQGDHGSHVPRPLARDGTGNHSSQAMTDEMNPASGFQQRSFDGLIQAALDEKIRTFCIDADAGKIRAVSDPLKPGMKFRKVNIGAKKSGNDDDARIIAAGNAQAIVDGGSMEQ